VGLGYFLGCDRREEVDEVVVGSTEQQGPVALRQRRRFIAKSVATCLIRSYSESTTSTRKSVTALSLLARPIVGLPAVSGRRAWGQAPGRAVSPRPSLSSAKACSSVTAGAQPQPRARSASI
jgi:hypothetical protein